MNIFRKINNGICKGEGVILIVSAIVLIAAVMAQVVCRYVLLISTPWAEELARYMFCWMVPIGAGYCTARREHIEMGIVNKLLDKAKNVERMYRIWFYIGRICEMVFLVLFGIIYIKYLLNVGRYPQYSVVMHINMMYIMSAMFTGAVLMVVQGVLLVLEAFLGPRKPIREVGR